MSCCLCLAVSRLGHVSTIWMMSRLSLIINVLAHLVSCLDTSRQLMSPFRKNVLTPSLPKIRTRAFCNCDKTSLTLLKNLSYLTCMAPLSCSGDPIWISPIGLWHQKLQTGPSCSLVCVITGIGWLTQLSSPTQLSARHVIDLCYKIISTF